MSPVDLDDIIANGRYYLRELAKVEPRSDDPAYCGAVAEACSQHRRLGIAILLSEGDRREFSRHLGESGALRVTVLDMARPRLGGFEQWARQGLVGPFFDACVAGDDETAQNIARLSSAPHQPRYEYEEDYCYARWWYALALAGWKVDPEVEARFAALDTATGDPKDPRVRACRALMTADADLFDEAMRGLCKGHIQWFKERTADPEENRTEGAVFVEGLALLRRAQEMGLATAAEYPRVPAKLVFGAAKRPAKGRAKKR